MTSFRATLFSRKIVFRIGRNDLRSFKKAVGRRAIGGNTFSYLAPSLVRDFLPFTRISFPPFSRTRSSSIALPFPRTKFFSSNDQRQQQQQQRSSPPILFHQGRYFSID